LNTKDEYYTLTQLNEPIKDTPFDIPDNWTWTYLSEIGIINPRNITDDNLDVSFISMDKISATYGKPVDISEKKKWKDVKKGYTHLQDNDVIMAKITPCFENQKSAILTDMINGFGAGTTELHVFRKYGNINPRYILLYLKSPFFMQYAGKNMTGTAGQQRVPKNIFACYNVPLPPLDQQMRIVVQIDKFMELCNKVEQLINQ
jgi:type I restriction enzyme S subunit